MDKMGLPLGRIFFVVLLFQALIVTNGQKDKFPTMDDVFDFFYETEVQVTDLVLGYTGFAKEYYSDVDVQGRVDILAIGKKASIFYFRETGDILDINETACISNAIVNSTYNKMGIYHGWLTHDPYIIGPSALLWSVNDVKKKASTKVEYKETDNIRGIKCDWYQVKVKDGKDDMTYDYYFADPDWLSPNGKNGKRTPIRIAMKGTSATYESGNPVEVNQIVDFSYFRPTITDFENLLPPIGLGCFGKESSKYLPDIPNEFGFFEEEFDVMNADKLNVDVNFKGLFFEGKRQLARMDVYNRVGSTSNLHDFNTGVTYSIADNLKCEIKPLDHSYFENEGTDVLQGNMKTSKEVMGLNGNFYFLGTRTYRGIKVDVFEKAEFNSPFLNEDYYLTVITAFFTSSITDVVKDAEEMANVPVFFMDSMYETPNKLTYRKQYNVFGYNDIVGPAIYANFPIKDCFPLSRQKSYFFLMIKEGAQTRSDIESHHNQFIAAIKSEITVVANVSDLRIPLMKIDYRSDQIYATGMLLDRPPALKQFHLAFVHGHTTVSKTRVLVPDAKNAEQCAYACVENRKCGAFHFCGDSNGVCVINLESLATPTKGETVLDKCNVYIRAEMNSNNKEEYLETALKKLTDAVLSDKEFKVSIFIETGKETETITLIVADIIIGDGPFDRNPTDKDYSIVIDGAQLVSESQSYLVRNKDYIGTELECYESCRLELSLDCESFSYCPQSDNKQCRISSETFFLKEDLNLISTVNSNEDCNVYSLKYLDFFDRSQGKVLQRTGEMAFKDVTSVEMCAMNCKKETELPCRSFDFCTTQKTCIIHSTHITDLHPSEIFENDDKTCVHYSAKFSADYVNKGHHIIVVDEGDKKQDISVENCARSCSEEHPSCRNFIYCPANVPDVSSCSLTSLNKTSEGVKWKDDTNCVMYEKKEGIKDWKSKKAALIPKSTGYTATGFTGLVIGMIVFGLFVGVVGFLGFSYYKSRRPTDGMTVRFMKQTNA